MSVNESTILSQEDAATPLGSPVKTYGYLCNWVQIKATDLTSLITWFSLSFLIFLKLVAEKIEAVRKELPDFEKW